MDYLRLALALLLPWLGGYAWLAAIERRLGSAPGRSGTLRQIGYGLFLGYGALQGIVLAYNSLAGAVSFWPLLALLAALTLAGCGVLFGTGRPAVAAGNTLAAPATPDSPAGRLLWWLLVGWAVLHLAFVAIEILHRPVFPWDAWLNWMYRAKAWFYSGHVFVMDAPDNWLSGTGIAPYNVAGNHYPTFVPVIALWAATALGYWSETLTNLPVLYCGIALGLALYGQSRESGMPRWLAALAAYLLLSIPLVGAHLALAGQADIWMAGFAGLGFVALLRGCIENHRGQVLLGLAMTGIGIATKLEGAVWFIAGLLAVALARYTRATTCVLAALALIALLGWATGITYLDLPLLGRLGVAEGRLHIPLLGAYTLQSYDLWDDYRDNFFSSGTWHLLWLFVALSGLALKWLPPGTQRRSIAAFYVVLLAAQLFIFEGTQSGQWAEDWTAINRLPLHFAPFLVFALLVIAQAWLGRAAAERPGRAWIVVPLASLLLTLAGAVVYLLLAYPGAGGSSAATFSARDFSVVVGGGRQEGDAGIIERYQNKVAILSSGPITLNTRGLGLARLTTAGTNRNRAAFFWRYGNGPDDLRSVEVSGRGTRWIDLSEIAEWKGGVSEIGMIFYADGERPVEFHGLEIAPPSLASHLAKLLQDWRETSTWSQKSVHWLPAGAEATTLPLPALLCAWVLVGALLAALAARRIPGTYAGALLCAALAWAVLDLRWTANGLAQARATLAAYPLANADHLDFGDDGATRRLVERARPQLATTDARILVMAEDPTMRFQMLRAKYHALPGAALVHEGSLEQAPVGAANYLLVLKKLYAAPGHRPATAVDYAQSLNLRNNLQAEPLWDVDEGFLLGIGPEPATVAADAAPPGAQPAAPPATIPANPPE